LNPISDNKSLEVKAAKRSLWCDVHTRYMVCRSPRYTRRCRALHLSLAHCTSAWRLAAKNRKP
jgi:hypothetical protein